MAADETVERLRASVLELADASGRVAGARRRRGIARTRFYGQKRRVLAHGPAGLKDQPPVRATQPPTTAPRSSPAPSR